MEYVLVIDQGTTSTRSIAFNLQGEVLCKSQKEFNQLFPKPGYVEQDVKVVLESVLDSVKEVIDELGTDNLKGIGITNQRETTVIFDKEGKPIYNAISWQCRRTASLCEQLSEYEMMIKGKTGLVLDPYFSASKAYWLLHNVPFALEKALRNELLFGTMDTYLMYYLSEGSIFKTDVTNASRTMLYNIYEDHWDKTLCRLFDIPMSMLPEVVPSKSLFGYTSVNSIFKKAVPIYGVVGDQQAALFGHLCVEKNETKVTYGTGCFSLTNAGPIPPSKNSQLITTLGARYSDAKDYVIEGSVFIGGSLVKWMRDNLGIISSSSQTEEYALKVADTLGTYIVPAFTGLGAPYWDFEARGLICGLTTGVNKYHLTRAALESIAYQVADVIKTVEDDFALDIKKLYVDGGASVNNFLMQFQADILDCEVIRPADIETTSLGAFFLVVLGLGVYNSIDELKKLSKNYRSFYSGISDSKRNNLLSGWKNAVNLVLRGNYENK